ncbi:hypothetical protein CK203_089782 [Vitis vinifera]|uniref:Uncharacterized protein n=1 Tax=Vitis vinifera TaxID=29760 RepID=A0A438BLD1_VITVI|nr:hypothetical protein CK203_089782 [Vitis vinifera]
MRNHPSEPNSPRNVFLPKLFPLLIVLVINFVDYSLKQGAPIGHESAGTPIGHESAPPSPPASTIPGSSHVAQVLKRPMIAGPPLPGNTDIRDRPFHDEICMEHETLRLLPELEESYRFLQRYHIEPFMTPRSFYYPRVVLDFYQTMTTRGVQDPIAIHFLIDG